MPSTLLVAAILALSMTSTFAVCRKGKFINKKGKCVSCKGNFYNDIQDATSCKRCPNGQISPYGSKSIRSCRDCPQGMQIVFDNECETCDPGTFNDKLNSRKCKRCPKGTFTNTYNPAYCRPCRAGRVTNERGTIVCSLCTKKNYQPRLGKRLCIKCPKGSTSNEDGASCRPTCDLTDPACKSCPPGTEMDSTGGCQPCQAGAINAFASITKCQQCPDAHVPPYILPGSLVPNSDRTKCICRPGEFLSFDPFGPVELNPFCIPCAKGQTSDGVTCS